MPLARGVLDELRRALGPDGLVVSPEGRLVYERDIHTFYQGATNAGGPHCLKYGITANHVVGLELVTGAGEVVRLGGKVADRAGYDLTGVAVGSEGTFGLVTAVTVRLLHTAEAVKTILASFRSIDEASEAVSAIIAAGVVPAAPA